MRLEIACSACDCAEVLRPMTGKALLRIVLYWLLHHKHGDVVVRELVTTGDHK